MNALDTLLLVACGTLALRGVGNRIRVTVGGHKIIRTARRRNTLMRWPGSYMA